MDRTGTEFPQGGDVLSGSVPFVFGKCIPRKHLIVLHHHPVPCDLGYDAGSRDGNTLPVTADDRNLRNTRLRDRDGVVQQDVRFHTEL